MSQPKGKLSRRTLFAGAGTAGAVAAAATLLPATLPKPASVPEIETPPPNGGGYRLTDHVRRYYKTTLI